MHLLLLLVAVAVAVGCVINSVVVVVVTKLITVAVTFAVAVTVTVVVPVTVSEKWLRSNTACVYYRCSGFKDTYASKSQLMSQTSPLHAIFIKNKSIAVAIASECMGRAESEQRPLHTAAPLTWFIVVR